MTSPSQQAQEAQQVPGPVVARAQKAQRVAWIAAVAIVVVFTAVAFTLRGKTESGRSYFHVEDQIAMIVLGLFAAVAILWLTRPRVIADADGLRVRNLLGWIEVPWEIVTAVRFDRGSPWVAVDLRDDDVISVMAVQAADKDYAVAAVRGLRALLAASRPQVADAAPVAAATRAADAAPAAATVPVQSTAPADPSGA